MCAQSTEYGMVVEAAMEVPLIHAQYVGLGFTQSRAVTVSAAIIIVDRASITTSRPIKDDMLRQETNEGEENDNSQLHQSEIKNDQISLDLDSGDDPLRPTANEGEEKENNQLQGKWSWSLQKQKHKKTVTPTRMKVHFLRGLPK
ncbi:unnamed protein product [Dovyalis caffra]|uniref:Uncharacterized protein n=1 Tax=Dovyalis caffra TaxID=77055 RepID=A0AAV1RXB6_9ROSI|nr:unnamed protein product [Dovyalis caffra]